jgi:hypothetical protein
MVVCPATVDGGDAVTCVGGDGSAEGTDTVVDAPEVALGEELPHAVADSARAKAATIGRNTGRVLMAASCAATPGRPRGKGPLEPGGSCCAAVELVGDGEDLVDQGVELIDVIGRLGGSASSFVAMSSPALTGPVGYRRRPKG